MESDEPFTLRTVAITTGISLIVFFSLVAVDITIVIAWVLSAILNVVLFSMSGIVLQIRAASSDLEASVEAA